MIGELVRVLLEERAEPRVTVDRQTQLFRLEQALRFRGQRQRPSLARPSPMERVGRALALLAGAAVGGQNRH